MYTKCEFRNLRAALNGHLDKFVIVAITPGLFVNYNFILVFGLAGLWNLIFAFLTVRKLRSFRASFSAATYKMHIRLVVCLLCQVELFFYHIKKIFTDFLSDIFVGHSGRFDHFWMVSQCVKRVLPHGGERFSFRHRLASAGKFNIRGV